jgi:CheY-like chemotaxis protein
MDLHMPVMNGYDAATEIRRISEHVPIVAMTADVIEGVKEKCRAHGITHYISKPFDPEHFVRTINAILHGPEAAAKSPCEFLDRAKGLRNLGGNAQAYEMVLGEFYRENAGTVKNLSCALDEKRYADAVSIVHKIKGSAGSIGADRLHSTAARLQKAIEGRSHPEIQSLGQEFVSLLTDLLKRIRPA